jgi:secreted PhoX family phosphatase
VRTIDDPAGRTILGTLGNCAGGTTPWGTILSGEENFNGYFVSAGTSAGDRRYGLGSKPTARGWEIDEARFDTRTPGYENEKHRFGYIVEVDPFDPTSTPRKHSALGRFKHEGANVSVAPDGRVVAYSGDDERFDYLYKFVSTNTVQPGNTPEARRANMTLLSQGSLYVARFQGNSVPEINGTGALPADGAFDGVGEWLPLLIDNESAVPGMSAAEVAVFTRLAADKVGPTKMDRCEDVEPNPATGRVYVACTNNTNRGTGTNAAADEANPRTANRDGHVVELTEAGGNPTSTRFTWNLLLVCGDPAKNPTAYFSGYPADRVSPISCPDNLAFDSAGNLWISTDGQPGTIGYCDGCSRWASKAPSAAGWSSSSPCRGTPRRAGPSSTTTSAPCSSPSSTRGRTAAGTPRSPGSPTTCPPVCTRHPARARCPVRRWCRSTGAEPAQRPHRRAVDPHRHRCGSARRIASVEGEVHPGDPPGLVGGQVQHAVGDIDRPGRAA